MKSRILKLNAVILFLVLLIFGCKAPVQETAYPVVVDMENSFFESSEFNSDNFLESIQFIKLETSDEFVIADGPNFYTADNYIVKDGANQIYLFDKESGNFIREIGINDNSPEGYRSTGRGAVFDEENKLIYTGGWNNNHCVYNFQGKKVNDVKRPENEMISAFGLLNDSIFAGFLLNVMGDQKFKIVLHNETGNTLKKYPNYHSYKKVSQSISIFTYEGLFYRSQGNLFFKEMFDDTLFQVKADTILPRYVFDGGQHSPEYEKRDELVAAKQSVDGEYSIPLDEYYVFTQISESSRFIIFKLRYKKEEFIGIYDKTETLCQIAENNVQLNLGDELFLPFNFSNIYINNNNELVTYIEAYELLQWMNENPADAKKLVEKFDQFKNIDENDNPFVVIAKLKS